MKALLLTLLTALSTTAFAAGGMHCEIQDKHISFSVGGGLSHGIPSRPWNVKGSIEFKADELKAFNQSDFSEILQYWDMDGDMNLVMYKEPETKTHSYINLVIRTNFDHNVEEDYIGHGKYSLTIYFNDKAYEFDGKVTCEHLG